MRHFRRFVDWFLLTEVTRTLSEREARTVRTTAYLQLIMFLLPTLLLPVVFFTEPPETHVFTYAQYFPLVVPLGIARYLLQKGMLAAAGALSLVAVDYHLGALTYSQADDPAQLGLLILALLPFAMVPRENVRTRWVLVVLPLSLFVFFQWYYRVHGGSALHGPPKWVVPADFLLPPLVLLLALLVFIPYQFVKAVDSAEDNLAAEHAKSEKLLLNILPREVAEELKAKGSSKPRHFSSATVCFTDFEGFTKIAEALGPEELVAELDRCFSHFDTLMGRYNLEKLKTIGDSYMFAGGIPTSNRTHAVDCVMAALEIQAFMNQMKEIKASQNLPYWQLRLGIHSGDLVAGVIGEKKFAYDVWSDTVNTASRCESSGVTGKINISGATHQLVRDFFVCEYRGAVPAKNKGNIEMYFVEGLLPELQRPDHARTPNSEFERRYAAL